MTRRVVAATMLLAALAAAGCGRRSDPLTPYEAAVEARREAEKNNQPLPPEPTPPVKDRPFILDRLIE